MLSPILLHHEHRDHVVSALSAQNYVLYDVRLTIFTDVYLFCSEKGAVCEQRYTGEGCLRHLETLDSIGQKNKIGKKHVLV